MQLYTLAAPSGINRKKVRRLFELQYPSNSCSVTSVNFTRRSLAGLWHFNSKWCQRDWEEDGLTVLSPALCRLIPSLAAVQETVCISLWSFFFPFPFQQAEREDFTPVNTPDNRISFWLISQMCTTHRRGDGSLFSCCSTMWCSLIRQGSCRFH